MTTNLNHSLQNLYIWFNGNMVLWDNAKIHVMTHGLHYASSVFEGIATYNSKPFKLKEHIQRLLASAELLKIGNIKYDLSEIIDACVEIIKKNRLNNGYLRPLIWRGSESTKVAPAASSINIMIAGWEISRLKKNIPFSLVLSKWIKPHPNSVPHNCKMSGQYPMLTISALESKEAGYDDALLLDWRGYIAECTSSNIFFIKNNEIITPIADAFLDGITRQTVIEIAKKLSLKVKEQYIVLDDLEKFQECFLTGTAMEIQRVGSIKLNKTKVTFSDYKVTNKIQEAYYKIIE